MFSKCLLLNLCYISYYDISYYTMFIHLHAYSHSSYWGPIKLQFAFPFNNIIYIILVFLYRTSFIHMMYIKFFSSAMKTIVLIYWITTDNDTIQILP